MESRNNLKLTSIKKVIICTIVYLFSGNLLYADQIDLGIFESVSPGEIEIRMKPDYQLTAGAFITEIRYTIRWQDPSIVITNITLINPFNLPVYHPEAPIVTEPIFSNGYYYQSFQNFSNLAFPLAIAPGQEQVISRFNYSGGPGATIELSNEPFTIDDVTYYYEINGLDVTGVFYEPTVNITPPLSVPVSDYAIFLTMLLISVFIIFRLHWYSNN